LKGRDRFVERMLSVVATCRQQGDKVLESLRGDLGTWVL
jgi:hypothetical protein